MYLSANLFLSYRAIGLLASHFAECPVASEVEPHPLIYLMQTLQFPLKSNTGIQRLCASLILTEWATSQKVFKFLTLMVLSAFCNVSLYIIIYPTHISNTLGCLLFTFITLWPFWSLWRIKALSLYCLCASSLTLNERFDGQNLFFGHGVIWVYWQVKSSGVRQN